MTMPLPQPILPDVGIIEHMPESEYHALDRFSCSGVKAILRSPAHLKAERDKRESVCMKQGSLIDVALTEPERLISDYLVIEDDVVQNPRHKAFQAIMNKAGTRIIVRQSEMLAALRIQDAVQAHATTQELLDGAQSQQVALWHEATDDGDIPMKARLDWVNPRLNTIIDLKSTDDVRHFSRIAARFCYHIQEACYSWGWQQASDTAPDAFIFVVVEREPPHGIKVCELPPRARELGWQHYRKGVELFAACQKNDQWHGYEDNGIEPVDLPIYYYRLHEDQY